jgi:hypothetical protein
VTSLLVCLTRVLLVLLLPVVLVLERRAAMSLPHCVEGLVLVLERGWVVLVASMANGMILLPSELPTYVLLPFPHLISRMLTAFVQVSEMAEENELRDMFERFGRVTRVFLAKDRDTGLAKGFAFISFADRNDAVKACQKMDGYGFKHLILRVEFAKKAA